jgi:hypothetical protein
MLGFIEYQIITYYVDFTCNVRLSYWSTRHVLIKYSNQKSNYRLAIFQLFDDTERLTPYLAFISFCTGCLNVPLDLLLLGGALFRQSCGLVPWIVITLLVSRSHF